MQYDVVPSNFSTSPETKHAAPVPVLTEEELEALFAAIAAGGNARDLALAAGCATGPAFQVELEIAHQQNIQHAVAMARAEKRATTRHKKWRKTMATIRQRSGNEKTACEFYFLRDHAELLEAIADTGPAPWTRAGLLEQAAKCRDVAANCST